MSENVIDSGTRRGYGATPERVAAVLDDPRRRLQIAGIPVHAAARTLFALLVLLLVVFPLLVDGYDAYQGAKMLAYAIAVLGLNLLTGFNGQFSLGHSAFFAIGAYTTAMLMAHAGMPYWATLFVSAGVCFIAGFLFGLPALRLEGLYLALATFALATAMPQLLKHDAFEHWTGGVQGLVLDFVEPPSWLPFEMDSDVWKYYFCLIVAALMFWFAWNLLHSRVGRAIIAIRDNPLSAKTMGINNAVFKSTTFGISGLYTGVAGSLLAILDAYVAPDSFTFLLAVLILVGSVVGGVASVFGALFGGLFMLLVPNLSEQWARGLSGLGIANPQGLSWAVYGLFLIFTVYVIPMGAAGLIRMGVHRFARMPNRR